MSRPGQRPSEDDLIARFFAPLAGAGGLGLKDDAALMQPAPGHDLVVTVDALVAGVHFFADDPPASIARKALGVNLSDLAAKGAAPSGFLLGLALPDDWRPDWLAAFAQGLGEAAAAGQCPLLGGDTVRTPGPLTLSITALGEVSAGRMVRRTTARAGDIILVSGSIGDAALGLKIHGAARPGAAAPAWGAALDDEQRGFLADRYLHPRPRQALAPVLRQHAGAAMDVSDGLIGDAAKMMRASGVSALVEIDRVPLSPATRAAVMADPSVLGLAMTGGDDYEVLCTVAPGALAGLLQGAEAAGVALQAIGEVLAGPGPVRFTRSGRDFTIASGSFSHF